MDAAVYEHLSKLRDIDEKVLKLQRQKAQTPPEIVNLKKKIAEQETVLKLKEKSHKEEHVKQSNISGVIVAEKDKLAKSETKLPQVKNSKEYQAVVKEVDRAKKTIFQLEEQEKAQKIVADEAKKAYEKYKGEFDATSKEYEKNLVTYKDKANSIDMDIKDLLEERTKEIQSLPENVKKQYELLHLKLQGASIANVNNGRCNVCNMTLSPQVVNNLLKCDEIQRCSSCQRILIR